MSNHGKDSFAQFLVELGVLDRSDLVDGGRGNLAGAAAALMLSACGVPPPKPPPVADDGNGILYHGGPVLTGDLHVRLVWGVPRIPELRQVLDDVSGSAYFATLRTYHDAKGNRPTGVVVVDSEHDAPDGDPGQLAASLGPGAPVVVVTLTSNAPGFHAATREGVPYAVVRVTPDDAPESAVLHELAEMVTNPLPGDAPAWVGSTKWSMLWDDELADLCGQGPEALWGDVQLGPRTYRLQALWLNADGGRCTLGG